MQTVGTVSRLQCKRWGFVWVFFSMDFYFFGLRALLFFLIGCTWTRVLMCYIDICDVWDNFNIALGLQRRLLFWTKWLSRQNNRDEGLLTWHPRSAECTEQVQVCKKNDTSGFVGHVFPTFVLHLTESVANGPTKSGFFFKVQFQVW